MIGAPFVMVKGAAAKRFLQALALLFCVGHAAAEDIQSPLGLPPVPAMVAGTPAMRRLGEKLFFDRSLSANGTLSCAMCHIPAQGFASNQSALSIGMEGRSLRRNAPRSIMSPSRNSCFTTAARPISPRRSGGRCSRPTRSAIPGSVLIARLRADADYGPLFETAFPEEGATMMTLGRAIAAL